MRTTTTEQTYQSAIAFSSPGSGTAWLHQGLATIHRVLQRRQQRRALLDCDDHMLEDMGISRAQALEEARKPFWR